MSDSPAAILHNTSGTEVATSANPLRVDPTGSTAQPVTDNSGSLTVDAPQLPAALVGGRLDNNVGAWLGSTAPTVGQKDIANSLPVTMASEQVITVQFGTPGGGTALPKLVNINFTKTEGAVVANVYKRIATYVVPATYNGYLIKYVSFQGEAATSRVVAETNIGSFNDSTNVWTAGTMYSAPQWAAIVQAEVTTAFAAGSGNVVLTVGYTNHEGTAGRSGTITIPKGSALLSRWNLVLQTDDLGVQSIQTVTGTPAQVGVVKILGLLQLAVHQDQSTTTQTETLYAPGAITFPPLTVLGLEYAGGTVAKQRFLDVLIQLVQ